MANVCFFSPAAWLRVEGDDAGTFLQGQFTNELRFPQPQGCAYGLWLNAKGRVLADSFVLAAGANAFWLASRTSLAAVIRERLEAFIIADDVTVTDATGDWRCAAVWGEGAVVVVREAGLTEPAAGAYAMKDGALIFAGRHDCAASYDICYPVADATAWTERLTRAVAAAGGCVAGTDALETARIAAGIPAVPADIGPGELPNEGGLEAGAISYTKGCYTGQEVMARLKAMGQVRRALRRVRGSGRPPPLPAALYQRAKKVAELRSVATVDDGFIGLALVTLLQLDETAPLGWTPEAPAGVELWREDSVRHG